jgi:hypothetical protein
MEKKSNLTENEYRFKLNIRKGTERILIRNIYGRSIEEAAAFLQHLLCDYLVADTKDGKCFYYYRSEELYEFVLHIGRERVKVKIEKCEIV